MAAEKAKSGGGGQQMTVVRGLDVARYMGRWYEIASFPSLFQPRDGRDTRATYRLLEDGATVHVLNETWSKGKRDYIEGTAYKADPGSDEAKLKVKFYLPPFLPIVPVVGDYWVLYVDDGYQYALVGEPRRKNLWVCYVIQLIASSSTSTHLGRLQAVRSCMYVQILCRKTSIDEDVYNQLVERAKEEGYDVSKLHRTPQDDPPPESDAAPTDTKGVWWFKSLFGK
jgi:apolipoprotein D and lipocalin family protein